MKQLVKVYMLPTEDKTHIVLRNSDNKLLYYKNLVCNDEFVHLKGQHLYFTSDEEIEINDWCLDLLALNIFKVSELNLIGKLSERWCRKIVATTDKSLKIETEEFFNTSSHGKVAYKKTLPQIPQQFIEDYCKAGGIDEIYIETEDFCKRAHPFKYCPDCKGFKSDTCGYGKDLLLDSNNCVIIHPIKDSWNRKEIETLFNRYNEFISHHEPKEWQDWINKNLK